MSGSRLGRGRSGRLAVYGGCGVVVLLLVYLYRAAASEMARLKDLHVQCAHQQEALAAQLQVIFEYKVRLEKSLAEEKSSNAAVKQELQQRASREKTLRDKDSIEAMQRYNSLQQSYKLLQTEHQDRQEECKKQEKQALEEKHKLESALQDKSKSMEQLKNKYMQLETNKTRLEDKYNELEKSTANMDSTIEHYKKITAQLETELKIAKDACKVDPLSNPSEPRQLPDDDANDRLKSNDQMQRPSQSSKEKEKGEKAKEKEEQQQQSQQQQQQSTASPSSMKATPAMKSESSTKPSNNLVSASADKVPLQTKPVSRVKLPAGVVPIPPMMVHKIENPYDEQKETKKKDDPVQNSLSRNKMSDAEEKERISNIGNLNPPFAAVRHVADQIVGRRDNSWFKVEPGVQEFGDGLDRLNGLEDVADRQGGGDAGDDQYDGADYEKDLQQKNNNDLHLVEAEAEAEDEAEDEEDQDYPHDLKENKHV